MKFFSSCYFCYWFMGLFLYCTTIQEIPSPLKGSSENPVFIPFSDIKNCMEKFYKQYGEHIEFLEVQSGVDFHLVDIFQFPYSVWVQKTRKMRHALFSWELPVYYIFYVDPYHKKNECQNTNIETILQFPD